MTGGILFDDKDKVPTIFKLRWKKDTERTRNALLDHLDDLRYADLITRATMRTPGEVFSEPPKHVLVVCPTCGVRDHWTQRHECPKCHQWIPAQTNLPDNVVTPEMMRKYAVVDP